MNNDEIKIGIRANGAVSMTATAKYATRNLRAVSAEILASGQLQLVLAAGQNGSMATTKDQRIGFAHWVFAPSRVSSTAEAKRTTGKTLDSIYSALFEDKGSSVSITTRVSVKERFFPGDEAVPVVVHSTAGFSLAEGKTLREMVNDWTTNAEARGHNPILTIINNRLAIGIRKDL